MELKASKDLEKNVIESGLCTLCGACVGMCPYFVAYKGRIVSRDDCSISQGSCRNFCPRISTDLDDIHKVIFETPYKWNSMGSMKDIFIARSTDPTIRSKAQCGGVVTALIDFALEEGFMDSAILTGKMPRKSGIACEWEGVKGHKATVVRPLLGGHPSSRVSGAITCSKDNAAREGVMVTARDEILDCAGSTYIASPTIEAFNRQAKADSRRKIGVVGTPCQVLALAKMRTSTLAIKNNSEKIGLVIGLFCTWALAYEEFAQFLRKRVSLSKIMKVDIPPPPANTFEVYTSSKRISFSLDKVRAFIRPGCKYCIDMTAEFADISVGAAEGINGWNTVIARSETGAKIIKKAKAKKRLEIDEMPDKNLEHLKEASLLKKKRALMNIIQRTGSADDLLYLKGDGGTVRAFLDEQER